MDTSPRDLDALLAHAGWARALARNLVRDRDRADDLVQRAWLAAMRRPPADGTPPRRWLATVLRNFVRQDAREASRREQREHAVARPDRAVDGDSLEDSADIQIRLITAVRELPEPTRSTVWARYYEGLAPREIAARDEVPVDTVKTRLARGLGLLRKRFDREHGGDRSAWVALFVPFADPRPALALPIGVLVMQTKWKLAIAAVVVLCGIGAWVGVSSDEAPSTTAAVASNLDLASDSQRGPTTVDEASASNSRSAIVPPAPVSPASTDIATPRLHGRVLDLERRPVAGLAIGDTGTDRPSGVQSAADGTFEIEPSSLGSALEAHASGWATVWVTRTDALRPDRPITIFVARTGRLAGIVLAPDGRGVEDAFVTTSLRTDSRRPLADVLGADAHEFSYATRTDASGHFDLGDVPLVDGTLTASHDERKSEAVEIPGGARDDLELRLVGSVVVLRGRVIDPGKDSAAGVLVALDRCVTRTEPDGTFALSVSPATLLKDGTLELVAARSGALPARVAIGTRDDVELAADRSFELVLGGAPLSIRGHVVDSDGRPITGAEVSVEEEQVGNFWFSASPGLDRTGTSLEAVMRGTPDGPDAWRMRTLFAAFGSRREGVTDADGAFTIGGLQDREYVVHAVSEFHMTRRRLESVAAGASDLRVVLDTSSPVRRVAGHVLDRGGRPIAGARVRVQTRNADDRHGNNSPTIDTDADGAFVFERVRGEIVDVTASVRSQDVSMTPWPDDRLDDLRIVIGRSFALQIDVREEPALATRFEVHDASTGRVPLRMTRSIVRQGWGSGEDATASSRGIFGGLSDVVTVVGDQLTVVLFRDKVEVARIPIVPAADGLTIVRR